MLQRTHVRVASQTWRAMRGMCDTKATSYHSLSTCLKGLRKKIHPKQLKISKQTRLARQTLKKV